MSEIRLLGGEPLLNKNINEYICIARSNFQNAIIKIVTNGLILDKMPISFWNTCAENNIVVDITNYPINVNHKKIFALAEKSGVKIIMSDEVKTMRHTPFDLNGRQKIRRNFIKCEHANNCINLKEGRVYTCSIIPNVEHFNNYFNKNLEVSDRDFIDIYKIKSAEEILEFIRNPMPFCKYCYISKRSYNYKWGISEKNISEWIAE